MENFLFDNPQTHWLNATFGQQSFPQARADETGAIVNKDTAVSAQDH